MAMPMRKLYLKLRECLEVVEDKELMHERPITYALYFSRLMRLLREERSNCLKQYVLHNLGKRKSAALKAWYERVKKDGFLPY